MRFYAMQEVNEIKGFGNGQERNHRELESNYG